MFKRKDKNKKSKIPIKNNVAPRIVRFILWSIIAFIVIRGVVSIIKPDQAQILLSEVKELEESTQKKMKQNTELLSFAEEFVKQWYTFGSEEEFKNQIRPYVIPEVMEQEKFHDFFSVTKVSYVNAYRMETYSKTQFDVFVEVTYSSNQMISKEADNETNLKNKEKKVKADKNKKPEEIEMKEIIITTESTQVVKVPIQVTEKGKYIVEGIPLVINDLEHLPGEYQKTEIVLEVIRDVTKYEETITNYLKAYYSESQSVTDYFLSVNADKSKLYGFEQGKVELISVEQVKAYRKAKGEVLCLVTYKIMDIETEMITLQQCNILLEDTEVERLYIKDMNTKIINVKENGKETKK